MSNMSMVLEWKFPDLVGTIRCVDDGTGQCNTITAFPGGIPSQADQDTWTAEYDALQTTRDWETDMQATDSSMPRWFEDYITENPVTLAPGRAKDSYDAKVALRAGRPV
jgi:hypothetical protein